MSEAAFDLIVVGSGAAGLSAALRAVELDSSISVGVLTAGRLLAGSSARAQGGVAAAIGADDGPSLHAADTIAVGAGLNDAAAVAVLTSQGSRSIQSLSNAGMHFEHDLGLEAGHGRRRILHAGSGATGQVLTSALLERANQHPRIRLHEHAPVSALEKTASRVTGVRVGYSVWHARAVVLATGGYAALWARTTNGAENRGSGIVMAWRAGASLADLEFVQFHPTALCLAGRPAYLLSEALRGEGARLVDAQGREVVDPLLPRDVLARALQTHLRQGNRVFLSLRHLDPEHIQARFGRLAATLRDFGLDLGRDPLPVAPAAHYCMGGIRTDTWGRTDVAGLYAAGEVACSGVQGANRLASNSLLECLVFGARAAEAALSDTPDAAAAWHTAAFAPVDVGHARGNTLAAIDPQVLGARLDAVLGVEREPRRLRQLVADLPAPDALVAGFDPAELPEPDALVADLEAANLAQPAAGAVAVAPDVLLAALIARSALLRRESRGAHFRTDAPEPHSAWRGRIHWHRARPPAFEEVL